MNNWNHRSEQEIETEDPMSRPLSSSFKDVTNDGDYNYDCRRQRQRHSNTRQQQQQQYSSSSSPSTLVIALRVVLNAALLGTLVYASVDYYYRGGSSTTTTSTATTDFLPLFATSIGDASSFTVDQSLSSSSSLTTAASYVSGSVRGHGRITTETEAEIEEDLESGFFGRDLASAFQTDTVHHKTTTATSTTTSSTKSNADLNNDNDNDNDVDADNNNNDANSYKTTYHYTNPKPIDDKSGEPRYFLKNPVAYKLNDEDAFDPQIAWLASFPNSGTSFTMTMVARATNTTFATNYGLEANYGLRDTPSMPIYPRHPEGPYMPDPATSYHHRELPYGRYVMTKTHCGGYCVNCGPKEYAYGYSEYVELEHEHKNANESNSDSDSTASESEMAAAGTSSLHVPQAISFLHDCASGHAIDSKSNLVDVSYPPERVARVIHLIRNPFHNVIARFHLERKHHRDANTTRDDEWLIEHPDNHEGMNKFCEEQNDLRRDEETKFFESGFFQEGKNDDDVEEAETSYARRNGDHHSSTSSGFSTAASSSNKSWKDIVAMVPCRGDLFRYVQWHNLLHQSLDYVPHKLPVLTVYYEDYQAPAFGATAHSILDFLELQPVAGDKRGNIKWAEFNSRTDYDGFFSDQQKESVRDFLQILSSFQVWGEIQHYFF